MASKTISKAKGNPLLAALITFASVAVSAGAIWGGVGLADRLHTTEAELLIYDLKAHTFASTQFQVLTNELVKIELIGKCRFLKSQIRALEDSIYVRNRDGADADYIHELESDLLELQNDYNALGCATLLA